MLERIQQKVAAGERLGEQELAALQSAARERGGPELRTAVAQALINADAVHEALPLLESARRDYPQSLGVHLALGRALVSLERWKEAEAPLRRALELNPGDPEPLKALAVVHLRRAEWRAARHCVEQALEKDPLDDEALLLLQEVQRLAPADLAGPASEAEFSRALLEELQHRSTPHLVQKGQLLVRTGRQVARLALDDLHHDYLQGGRPLHEAVAHVAQELAERTLGLPPGKLPLLARALPVLRDSSFLDRGEGAARREGPAGLWVFYAIDDPELVRYVPQGALEGLHLPLETLDEAAWRNLEARQAEVRALELEQGALRLSATPTELWGLAHGDGHDAARLLTPSHQQALAAKAGEGPLRVYLGLRTLVIACRADDAVAVAKLDGLEAARDGIAGAWRLENGRLTALPDWDL